MDANGPVTVVIDPGHGGRGPAGRSSASGVRGPGGTLEKDVMLTLGERVAARLGGNAVLTRTLDENLSLAERAALAQRYGARVFLSLHANAGPPGSRGPEVFVHPRAHGGSRQLATALEQELARFGRAGGVTRSAEMAVLAPERLGPETAACLLEVDYLSNPDGERRLRDPRALDGLSDQIARGVRRFLGGRQLVAAKRYPLTEAQGETPDPDVQRDPKQGFFEIVEDNTAEVPASTGADGAYPRGMDAAGAVDTIVNVAKTAWDVLKDNRPVANASSDFANAIPQGASLEDVAGWDPTPRRLRLRYHSANPIGINSTDVDLTVSWYFNGTYRGVGQYVNAATVMATADVAWGNTVNVVASINSPMNLGTREAPVGALPIRIRLTESNVFQSFTYALEGLVQGNGAGRIAWV